MSVAVLALVVAAVAVVTWPRSDDPAPTGPIDADEATAGAEAADEAPVAPVDIGEAGVADVAAAGEAPVGSFVAVSVGGGHELGCPESRNLAQV